MPRYPGSLMPLLPGAEVLALVPSSGGTHLGVWGHGIPKPQSDPTEKYMVGPDQPWWEGRDAGKGT